MRLITVPTREYTPTRVTIESAEAAFRRSGLRTICVSTADADVGTASVTDSLIFVSSDAVSKLVMGAEAILGQPLESLFGLPRYGRSYGGAANLCSLLAIATAVEAYYRFDDDCDFRATDFGPDAANEVVCGSYEGDDFHPRQALGSDFDELIRALDPPVFRDWEQRPKSGCLLIPRGIAKAAPFPVWFDDVSSLKPRGEIYDWERSLRPAGYSFRFDRKFSAIHRGGPKANFEWLEALALKWECAAVANLMAYSQTTRLEEMLRERRAAIALALGSARIDVEKKIRLGEIVDSQAPRFAAIAIPGYIRARARWSALMDALGERLSLRRLLAGLPEEMMQALLSFAGRS